MLSDQMESLLLAFLYEKRAYQTQFFGGIGMNSQFIDFAHLKGVELDNRSDEPRFREAFWRLVAKGLVVPGTAASGGGDHLPWVSITEYGVKCFEAGHLQVHDPRGYVASLRKRVPNLDPVVDMYVAEALHSFGVRNYLASSVMIGGALEKTIFDLTEVFGKTLKGKNKSEYGREVLSREKVKTRLDKFLEFLDKHGYKKKLDLPTREKLESALPAIANIIRITRNEIGHPTGRIVDQEEAEANLLLAKEGIGFSAEFLLKL